MTPKIIALILFALATVSANSASAQDGFRGGGIYGYRGTRPPVTVGGFVGLDGYGNGGAYGYGDANGPGGPGNANGPSGWYGISPGHDGCPRFRQRVQTPDGERVQMVPVC